MFYKGGQIMLQTLKLFKHLTDGKEQTGYMQFVLFTFRQKLASQIARYCSNHSGNYAFSHHRTICFASFSLKANPS